jgi:hypothetical protein
MDLQTRRERVLARAQFLIDDWKPEVAKFLGLPEVPRIRVQIAPTYNYALAQIQRIHANGVQVMTISPDATYDRLWLKENLGALMVHELTHATIAEADPRRGGVLQYGEPRTMAWAFEEGLADYTRLQLAGKTYGFPNAGWGEFHQRPLQTGYQDMAAFLRWQEKHRPGSVDKIAKYLSMGIFKPQSYEYITGVPIHEATKAYRSLSPKERTMVPIPTDTNPAARPPANVAPVNPYNPVHQQV